MGCDGSFDTPCRRGRVLAWCPGFPFRIRNMIMRSSGALKFAHCTLQLQGAGTRGTGARKTSGKVVITRIT